MTQELPVSLKITSQTADAQKDVKALGGEIKELKVAGDGASAAFGKQAASVDRLGAALNEGERNAQRLAAAQATLNNAQASGSISQERYNALLAQATQRWGAHNAQVVKGGVSAGQTAQAMRQLPAQFTDIITSLQGGISPFTVLIQQGGQIKDSFGGIGPAFKQLSSLFTVARVAIGGTLAILGSVAVAYKQGSDEVDVFNKATIMSGNVAGKTAGQLDKMAANIDKVVGTQAAAAEALAQLVGSGEVNGDNLQEFAQVAVEMERTVGQSVATTVKNFAELGKAPLDASVKLNETLHYLTASVYDQIKALMKLGQEEAAGELAQKAYATAMSSRVAQIEGNLGTLERAWRGIGSVAKEAWDAMLGIGRQETVESRLDAATERVERAQKRLEAVKRSGMGAGGTGAQDELAAAQAAQAAAFGAVSQKQQGAAAQAEMAKVTDEYIAATKANEKWTDSALTNQGKIDKALKTYGENLAKINAGRAQKGEGPVSAAQVAREQAEIRKSFGQGTFQNASADAAVAMARAKANLSLLQDVIKNGDAIIVQALKDGNVSLDAAYAARLAQLQTDTAAQRQAMQQEVADVDKALAGAKNSAERGPLTQKRIEIEAKLKLLDSNLQETTRQLGIWKTEQEKQLGTITAKVRVEVANLTGKFDRGAVEAQLKAQYDGEYKAAGQLTDPAQQTATRKNIDMLIQAGVAQAEFNFNLAEAQRLQSHLAVQEEATRTLATQGLISQTEADARLRDGRAAQVPQLQAIVAQLQAMRAAMPPDAAAALDQMTASIGQLQNQAAAATPIVVDLGTRLRNTAIDGLADAAGQAVTNFKNLRSAIGDTLKQIAGDIIRSGVKKALTDQFSASGGGSGGSGNFISTAISIGKSLFGFAEGGHIRGPGTGTSDSIPALVGGSMPIAVSNNEFIQPERAVQKYGLGFMEAVRTLRFPKPQFAFGGLVQAHQRARFATGGQVAVAGAASATGAPNVSIQFINNGTPQRVTEQSQQLNGKDLVVRVVLADLSTGGPISQGMRSTRGR